jgi:hypothetical protein
VSVDVKKVTKKDKVESYTFTGFDKCAQGSGTVAGADDNGTYFVEPQNINGRPHFVKSGPGIATRHLYFLPGEGATGKSRWVIAKTCNAEVMGACSYTRTDLIESKTYVYYPPNKVHTDGSFKVVHAAEAVDVLTAEAYALADQPDIDVQALVRDQVVNENVVEDGSASDVIGAALDSFDLGVELTRWRDSNHECVFFNNQTGIVSFLSLDAAVLRKNIHPVLLKHLESNNIKVGEELRNINEADRYWEILATNTGIKRTRAEAAKVLYSKQLLRYYLIYSYSVIIFTIFLFPYATSFSFFLL